MRTHRCGELRAEHEGQSVALCGWVGRRREHGEHLAFIDLRDHSGVVQCVVDGAADLRSEYVVRITGTVRQRPEGTINPSLATGEVEVGDCVVEILSAAEPPQSPQLFKQLLMVGGTDRYYQLARCLRDEDLRADRQYEFMQLDAEASFVTQDEVLEFISEAVLDAAQAVTGERPGPIAVLTWH